MGRKYIQGDLGVEGALSVATEIHLGTDSKVVINTEGIKVNDSPIATEQNLAAVAKSGSYNDLTDTPTIPAVPTNISAFNNDTGYLTSVPSEYVTETELANKKYLTSYTETDPTVPNHVKSITTSDISNWNAKSEFSGSYNDLTNKPTIPTKTSELTNNSDFATNASVDTKISNLVNSAPEALNTLGELATALEAHEDAYDALLETVGGKAAAKHTHTKSEITDFPTIPTVNNGTLTIQKNGSNVATFSANQSGNATANISVPTKLSELTNDSGFKTTDNNTTYSLTKSGSTITLTGSDGSTTSVNDDNTTYTIPTKSSWNYDDAYVKYSAAQSLTDAQKTQARNNIGAGTSSFSGNYNDLTNKPTIPTVPAVNNGTLTIQKNGSNIQTFTANQSSNVTANITVPTKVSELTNDSGFITGITVDSALSSTSTNPVQNKVINTALAGKADSSHTHSYLEKTSYEMSKELPLGSNGKVCLGKFGAYDSNITIELNCTTNTCYHATIVIATQNVAVNSTAGTVNCYVYGDANNYITPLLSIFRPYGSASRQIEVYANLSGWSKNLVHVQAVALSDGGMTDILTEVTTIPTAVDGKIKVTPVNALTANFASTSGATQSAAGLMSAADKKKLDGIAPGANAYTLPAASSTTLGGVKLSLSGTTLTITTT